MLGSSVLNAHIKNFEEQSTFEILFDDYMAMKHQLRAHANIESEKVEIICYIVGTLTRTIQCIAIMTCIKTTWLCFIQWYDVLKITTWL